MTPLQATVAECALQGAVASKGSDAPFEGTAAEDERQAAVAWPEMTLPEEIRRHQMISRQRIRVMGLASRE